MRLVAAAVGVGVGAAVLASFPTMGMLELIQLGVVVRMASSVLGWHQVVGTSWRPKAIRRKLKYELDYWFSTDPGAKVTSLLMFALCVALAGSVALIFMNGFDLNEALWLSTYWLADPGGMFDEPPARRVIALVVTVGGLLLSALIVSVIGDNISNQLDELRSGVVPVVESGHSVVLGWTSKTLTICRELAEAHATQRGGHVICVLAARPKADMMAEVAVQLKGQLGHTSVVCRKGNISLLSDLRKVSIQTAKSVVLLNTQHHASSSAPTTQEHETACIALRIKQLVEAAHVEDDDAGYPNVVIEVMDHNVQGCIDMLGIPNCATVLTANFTGQMMVNFATSPGLHQVITELTSFSGVEVYIVSDHKCNRRPFGEALMACAGGTVIGIRQDVAQGGAVVLNPIDSTTIGIKDDLVVISLDRNSCTFNPNTTVPPRRASQYRSPQDGITERRNYAFVNWRPSLSKMILEMDRMVAHGSTLTLFSIVPRAVQIERLAKQGVTPKLLQNLTLEHVTGHSSHLEDLRRLAERSFYSVFVFAAEGVAPDDSDTAIMSTALLLSELLTTPVQEAKSGAARSNAGRAPDSPVDVDIARRVSSWTPNTGNTPAWNQRWAPDVSSLLDSGGTAAPPAVEFIMCELNHTHHKGLFQSIDPRIIPVCADEIAGSAITQVALQPEMKPIFTELLSSDGCELYIYLAPYVIGAAVDDELTWMDVMAACRLLQFIAIGYITAHDEIVLNPGVRDVNRKWASDKLIVLAH
eukprot:m.250825 g.250825  ORF g.250825 m.250825 type:complete len:755 (+) comp26494_c0_seq1:148-2412(+)